MDDLRNNTVFKRRLAEYNRNVISELEKEHLLTPANVEDLQMLADSDRFICAIFELGEAGRIPYDRYENIRYKWTALSNSIPPEEQVLQNQDFLIAEGQDWEFMDLLYAQKRIGDEERKTLLGMLGTPQFIQAVDELREAGRIFGDAFDDYKAYQDSVSLAEREKPEKDAKRIFDPKELEAHEDALNRELRYGHEDHALAVDLHRHHFITDSQYDSLNYVLGTPKFYGAILDIAEEKGDPQAIASVHKRFKGRRADQSPDLLGIQQRRSLTQLWDVDVKEQFEEDPPEDDEPGLEEEIPKSEENQDKRTFLEKLDDGAYLYEQPSSDEFTLEDAIKSEAIPLNSRFFRMSATEGRIRSAVARTLAAHVLARDVTNPYGLKARADMDMIRDLAKEIQSTPAFENLYKRLATDEAFFKNASQSLKDPNAKLSIDALMGLVGNQVEKGQNAEKKDDDSVKNTGPKTEDPLPTISFSKAGSGESMLKDHLIVKSYDEEYIAGANQEYGGGDYISDMKKVSTMIAVRLMAKDDRNPYKLEAKYDAEQVKTVANKVARNSNVSLFVHSLQTNKEKRAEVFKKLNQNKIDIELPENIRSLSIDSLKITVADPSMKNENPKVTSPKVEEPGSEPKKEEAPKKREMTPLEKKMYERRWNSYNYQRRLSVDPDRAKREWKEATPEVKARLDKDLLKDELLKKDKIYYQDINAAGANFVKYFWSSIINDKKIEIFKSMTIPQKEKLDRAFLVTQIYEEYSPQRLEEGFKMLRTGGASVQTQKAFFNQLDPQVQEDIFKRMSVTDKFNWDKPKAYQFFKDNKLPREKMGNDEIWEKYWRSMNADERRSLYQEEYDRRWREARTLDEKGRVDPGRAEAIYQSARTYEEKKAYSKSRTLAEYNNLSIYGKIWQDSEWAVEFNVATKDKAEAVCMDILKKNARSLQALKDQWGAMHSHTFSLFDSEEFTNMKKTFKAYAKAYDNLLAGKTIDGKQNLPASDRLPMTEHKKFLKLEERMHQQAIAYENAKKKQKAGDIDRHWSKQGEDRRLMAEAIMSFNPERGLISIRDPYNDLQTIIAQQDRQNLAAKKIEGAAEKNREIIESIKKKDAKKRTVEENERLEKSREKISLKELTSQEMGSQLLSGRKQERLDRIRRFKESRSAAAAAKPPQEAQQAQQGKGKS